MRIAFALAALLLSACGQTTTVEEYPAGEAAEEAAPEAAAPAETFEPAGGSLPTTQPTTDPTGSEEAAIPAQ